jgi:hypothetical protein
MTTILLMGTLTTQLQQMIKGRRWLENRSLARDVERRATDKLPTNIH